MTTLAPTLAAISAGAVFMGANSYIGNAPNLMVKAIAEDRGHQDAQLLWLHGCGPFGILVPLFVAMTFIWFRLRTPLMTKPKVLVARAIFPEVIDRLSRTFRH
jgi:hypothetical protein